MAQYTIWLKNGKKYKVIADDFRPSGVEDKLLIFQTNGYTNFWVNIDELAVVKKEVVA